MDENETAQKRSLIVIVFTISLLQIVEENFSSFNIFVRKYLLINLKKKDPNLEGFFKIHLSSQERVNI